MTPVRFAAKYCGNFLPDGSCLGASFSPDGTIKPLQRKPGCVVATERCPYFEECVLPYADTCKTMPDKREVASICQAANSYRLRFGLDGAPKRACSDCGAPLAKGQQRCPECADARRKRSKRLRQQRWRGGLRQKPPKP